MSRSEFKSTGNRAAPDLAATRRALPRRVESKRSADGPDWEAEREAIARELHDNFGQFLTVMEFELAALADQPDFAPVSRDRITKLRKLTLDASRDLGRVAHDIRTASLEGLNLKDACERLLHEWSERSSLPFDLHVSLGERDLPAIVKTVLYRVLQEAITNVVKHARATRVGVILQALPREVRLVVEDDGVGLDTDASEGDPRRLGLLGIRERLALVGGTFEIESGPGRGTTLFVSVPQ